MENQLIQLNGPDGEPLGLLYAQIPASGVAEIEEHAKKAYSAVLETGDESFFWDTLTGFVKVRFGASCERIFLTEINL